MRYEKAAHAEGTPRLYRMQAALARARSGRRNDRYGALVWWMLFFQVVYAVIDVSTLGIDPGTEGMAPSIVLRLIKLTLLGLAAIVLCSRIKATRGVLRELNRFFLLFVGLAVCSVAWSIDRSVTGARLVALASMVSVCLAFAVSTWHPKRFQEVIRPAIMAVLIASLVWGIFHPALVKEHGDTISLKNAWHGLTWQKNVFGELASLGVILWFHAWLVGEVKAARALVWGGVAFICLYLSRSSTSLLCTAFSGAFMVIVAHSGWRSRRRPPYAVMAFTAVCLLYGLAVMKVIPGTERLLLDPVMHLTGKDLTFSARTEIWQVVGENIARHPFLGSGYGAYWGAGPVPSSPSYAFIGKMGGFWPTESHNGYIEITNDLGYAGLFCALGFLAFFLRQSLALLRIDKAQAVLYLAILFQQALVNLSESTLLDLDNFCFTIMTVAMALIARALYEHRRGNRPIVRSR